MSFIALWSCSVGSWLDVSISQLISEIKCLVSFSRGNRVPGRIVTKMARVEWDVKPYFTRHIICLGVSAALQLVLAGLLFRKLGF